MRCLGTGNAYVESDVASKGDTRSGYGCRGDGVGRAVRGRMDRKGLGTVGGTNSNRSSSMGIDYGKSSIKEVVRKVCCIWGTVKLSSHFSVKNAIVQLADIENIEKIHVKRKYKSTSTRKPKWWYVIHAEEEAILKPLEEIWVNIKLQTGWLLESCSRPVEILTESLHLHSNHNN